MVDINLIGDDKTGETDDTEHTDRVEDFTQTSSMDTQELAFEERTETFDTTKTAGFTQRRSYSSLISTVIILLVIVLAGWGVYFFMFKDKGDTQEAGFLPQDSEGFVEDLPADEDGSLDFSSEENPNTTADLDPEFQQFEEQLSEQQQPEQQEAGLVQEPVRQPDSQPQPRRQVIESPPARRPTVDLTPVASQFLLNSKNAIQGVTNVLSSVPPNLNVTLLSYTAQKVRIEVVAGSASEARDFANTLNQSFGSGNFSVVSENRVASNGRGLEKVLITGSMSGNSGSSNDGAQFLSLSQAQNWIKQTAGQFRLDLRQVQTHPSSYVTDYQRTPIMLRVYGSQSSLVGFLGEMSTQSINVELTKLLLVSPDMVSHSDENLVLVINLFLYEPA